MNSERLSTDCAVKAWLAYFQVWCDAEPGTFRYVASQRHLRALEQRYGLRLGDLPPDRRLLGVRSKSTHERVRA